MTPHDIQPATGARPRRVVCEGCGAEFGCTLEGPCWCSHEPFRLPLPPPGAATARDCLCPACLRARAADMKIGSSATP